jgi:Tfp pilus assembly protein PilP
MFLIIVLIINFLNIFAYEDDIIFENTEKTIKSPFTEGRDPFFRPLDALGFDNQGSYSLEKYNLDEFKLSGVVWSIKNPIALFEGPDGSKYKLYVGDTIGKNEGVITKIDNAQVEIEEIILGTQQKTIVRIKRG